MQYDANLILKWDFCLKRYFLTPNILNWMCKVIRTRFLRKKKKIGKINNVCLKWLENYELQVWRFKKVHFHAERYTTAFSRVKLIWITWKQKALAAFSLAFHWTNIILHLSIWSNELRMLFSPKIEVFAMKKVLTAKMKA